MGRLCSSVPTEGGQSFKLRWISEKMEAAELKRICIHIYSFSEVKKTKLSDYHMFKEVCKFFWSSLCYSLTYKTLAWGPHSFSLGLPGSTCRSKLGFLIMGKASFSLVKKQGYNQQCDTFSRIWVDLKIIYKFNLLSCFGQNLLVDNCLTWQLNQWPCEAKFLGNFQDCL